MSKIIALVAIILALNSCYIQRPLPIGTETTTVTTETIREIDVETEPDTTEVVIDLNIKYDLKSDSVLDTASIEVVLEQKEVKKGKYTVIEKITLKGNKLTISSVSAPPNQKIEAKDINTTTTEIKTVVVEVNKLTKIQQFLMGLGILALLVIVIVATRFIIHLNSNKISKNGKQ